MFLLNERILSSPLAIYTYIRVLRLFSRNASSKARKPSPSWRACSESTPIRSAVGKRSFLRSCPISSPTGESGPTRTGRKPKPNCTGRSANSRSNWIGLKKNRSCSCREEAGRSGPGPSGYSGRTTMRTLGSVTLDLLLSSHTRRAVEPGADAPAGRGVHEAPVLRLAEVDRLSAESGLRGQSKVHPGLDAADGARGHLSEAALEPSGPPEQAVSVSSERNYDRPAGDLLSTWLGGEIHRQGREFSSLGKSKFLYFYI